MYDESSPRTETVNRESAYMCVKCIVYITHHSRHKKDRKEQFQIQGLIAGSRILVPSSLPDFVCIEKTGSSSLCISNSCACVNNYIFVVRGSCYHRIFPAVPSLPLWLLSMIILLFGFCHEFFFSIFCSSVSSHFIINMHFFVLSLHGRLNDGMSYAL